MMLKQSHVPYYLVQLAPAVAFCNETIRNVRYFNLTFRNVKHCSVKNETYKPTRSNYVAEASIHLSRRPFCCYGHILFGLSLIFVCEGSKVFFHRSGCPTTALDSAEILAILAKERARVKCGLTRMGQPYSQSDFAFSIKKGKRKG